jgi:hypothetical protein
VRYRCSLLALAICIAARAEDITPRIGVIEVYGARKVSVQKIKSALGATTGGPLPSREGAEDRIDKISGVVASRVEAVCCEQNNLLVYVGVEEREAPHIEYHPAPTLNVTLPVELMGNYQTFLDQVAASIRARNADEDLTNGYSLMADPVCRQLQQSFLPFVSRDLATIDKVLRESDNPEQRAAAAYLLQYGPRDSRSSKLIVNALQYALQDPEDIVRENAMRSLHAVAVGSKLHPDQEIRIEPTWFVELMNSVVWSDRRNASLALVNLTDDRNPDTLALLRQRALPSVIEMARWHDLEHALPGFILAGRLAGLSEQQIKDAWLSGDREQVLEQAIHPTRRKH